MADNYLQLLSPITIGDTLITNNTISTININSNTIIAKKIEVESIEADDIINAPGLSYSNTLLLTDEKLVIKTLTIAPEQIKFAQGTKIDKTKIITTDIEAQTVTSNTIQVQSKITVGSTSIENAGIVTGTIQVDNLTVTKEMKLPDLKTLEADKLNIKEFITSHIKIPLTFKDSIEASAPSMTLTNLNTSLVYKCRFDLDFNGNKYPCYAYRINNFVILDFSAKINESHLFASAGKNLGNMPREFSPTRTLYTSCVCSWVSKKTQSEHINLVYSIGTNGYINLENVSQNTVGDEDTYVGFNITYYRDIKKVALTENGTRYDYITHT